MMNVEERKKAFKIQNSTFDIQYSHFNI